MDCLAQRAYIARNDFAIEYDPLSHCSLWRDFDARALMEGWILKPESVPEFAAKKHVLHIYATVL